MSRAKTVEEVREEFLDEKLDVINFCIGLSLGLVNYDGSDMAHVKDIAATIADKLISLTNVQDT